MIRVETKLATWRGIYDRHLEAQKRLSHAMREGRRDGALSELRAEVRRLQEQSDAQLAEIQELIRAVKEPHAAGH
jgi:hypothetical protein